MQHCELEVIKILKAPRPSKDNRYWIIDVQVKAHGHTYETAIIKATETEIKSVTIGYTYHG